MIRRAAVCPPLLLAAALLAGCGSADPGTAPSASTGQATATAGSTAPGSAAPTTEAEDTGTDVPPFEGGTEPATQEASADALVTVSDIRTARQEGFDRVVLETGGAGTPGWDVRYVEEAYAQGTGDPVEVAGEAVLQVTITGAGYPFDTGVEEWTGPDPLPGSGTRTVTEVAWDATFEGTSVAFVGTRGEAPFRVYALEGPTRVVIEVGDLA
ncbi:AMIN-like domain-containing (lipo)protein [Geodermatophilus sp. SYSU D01176]